MVASCCHEAQRSLMLSAAAGIDDRRMISQGRCAHCQLAQVSRTVGKLRKLTMWTTSPDLFLRACRREPVERTPIWMMRQAGRYLPAYRAVRARTTFLDLCRTPDLACEVTLQPIDELGFDAAILFSDILITLPAMGIDVEFPDAGPKIKKPVRTAAVIAKLAVPDPVAELPYVMDAIRRIQTALAGRVPLIGFAGAPLTM